MSLSEVLTRFKGESVLTVLSKTRRPRLSMSSRARETNTLAASCAPFILPWSPMLPLWSMTSIAVTACWPALKKPVILTGMPSSVSSKASWPSPRTGCPVLSRTNTWALIVGKAASASMRGTEAVEPSAPVAVPGRALPRSMRKTQPIAKAARMVNKIVFRVMPFISALPPG